MTTIYLTATDQVLAVSQRPKIAAGDVDSVKLHVDFDSMWNRYAGKTAVFYTSHDATRYEVMLKLGECIIPHEVLCKEGTLFIGVRALSTDGLSTKTSTIVKQKLVKGADTGARTLLPSPDLYSQFVADADDKVNELVNAQIDKWDDEIEKRKDDLDDFLVRAWGFMKGTTLWTNEEENTAMTSKKIQKDLSEFCRFKILYKYDTEATRYEVAEITEKDKSFLLTANALNSSTVFTDTIAKRGVTFTNEGISFSTGYNANVGDQDSSKCIPCKVIAYKY